MSRKYVLSSDVLSIYHKFNLFILFNLYLKFTENLEMKIKREYVCLCQPTSRVFLA